MAAQNYRTADQSAYVGVAGNNMSQDYGRYKSELDRQRKEREDAAKKAKQDWWKRALVNGVGGAVQGFAHGGPGGAAAGFAAGAGLSAISDAAGIGAGSYGMGGANMGGMAGMAYKRYAANNSSPATGAAPASPMAAAAVPSQPMPPPPPTGMATGAGSAYSPMDDWEMFDRRNRY